MRTRLLGAATFALLLHAAGAQAQAARARDTLRIVHTDTAGGMAVSIGAHQGRVRITMRVSKGEDSATIAERWTVVTPWRRYTRLHFSPDSVTALVARARDDLAKPAEAGEPREYGKRRVDLYVHVRTSNRLSAVRSDGSFRQEGSYRIYAQECDADAFPMSLPLERWRRFVEALAEAARIASAQRTASARTTRESAPETENVSCPAQLLAPAEPPRVEPNAARAASRTAVVELTVDTAGAVDPQSIRRVAGDTALGRAARAAMRDWTFTPATDVARTAVLQRVRILVVDPGLAADSAGAGGTAPAAGADVRQRARDARADVIAIAVAMPRSRERIVRSDGIAIRTMSYGADPRVILVHAPGERHRTWDSLIAALHDGPSAITYDLRGHGGSSTDPHGDYSVDAHVRDLGAILDTLRVHRPVLVAHRGAAAIVAEYARRNPQRVAGVVLARPRNDTTAPVLLESFHSARAALAEARGTTFPDHRPGMRLLAERANRERADTPPDALAGSEAALMHHDLASALAGYPGAVRLLLPATEPRDRWNVDLAQVRARRAPFAESLEIAVAPRTSSSPLIPARALADMIRSMVQAR